MSQIGLNMLMMILVSVIKARTCTERVLEQRAEENIWAEDG